MPPHQRVERWLAERLMQHVEPRVEHIVHEFLMSERGRYALMGILAEATADLLTGGHGQDDDLVEQMIIKVAIKLANTRPDFRRRLLASLSETGLPVATPPR